MKMKATLFMALCLMVYLPTSAAELDKPIDATNEIEQIEQETNKPAESLDALLSILAQLIHAMTTLATEAQNNPPACANITAEATVTQEPAPQTEPERPLTTEEIKQKIIELLKLEHENIHRAKRTTPKIAITPFAPEQTAQLVLAPELTENSKKEAPTKPSAQKTDKTTSAILGIFAEIAMSFSMIVANPRNPKVVGASLTSMLAGIVSIFAQASRKNRSPNLHIESIVAELQQDECFIQRFNERIIGLCITNQR